MVILKALGKRLSVHFSQKVPARFSYSSAGIMSRDVVDIEELHHTAIQKGSLTYVDPETGFQVFTELTHLKRGFCCGNQCRHCPYGFQNVKNGARRKAKLESGDRVTAKEMINAISQIPATPRQHRSLTTSAGDTVTDATTKNVPYTRKGDTGTSQLGTGERRSKTDDNFEAMGTVDELCSVVGVVHSNLDVDEDYGNLQSQLLEIMSRLFDIGSHIAKPRNSGHFRSDGIGGGFNMSHVDDLETWINEMTEELPQLTSFILPTGARAAAHLHVARTVCRRAERRLVPLVVDDQTCDPNSLKYINRVSDYFFVAARWVNYCEGKEEIQYQRAEPGLTQRQRVSRSLQD